MTDDLRISLDRIQELTSNSDSELLAPCLGASANA